MDDQRRGLRGALVSLQHRDYRLFYLAAVVTHVGVQLQATANIIQVYEITGSAFHLGLTGLARGIPTILLSLMGGVMADRMDRRRLIMTTQALNGLLALALGALTATGAIDVWHIYAVIVLNSVFSSISQPARSAIIPNLVPRHHLMNALALQSTVWQTGMIVGPAVAGVGIALFGFPATYLGNAATHALTVAAMAVIYLGEIPQRPRGSPLRNLVEGLAFVRKESVILVLLAMDVGAVLLASYRALLPIFAANVGVGAEGTGLLFAAPAAGAMVGTAIIMGLGDVRYKGIYVVVGILAYCGMLLVLAGSPWFLLSLLAAGGLGLFDSVQAVPRNTVIQALSPDHLRGRVSSIQSMSTTGAPSLGQMWSGTLASVLGAPLAVTIGAASCAALVLGLAAARPDVRKRDLGFAPVARPPEPEPEVSSIATAASGR